MAEDHEALRAELSDYIHNNYDVDLDKLSLDATIRDLGLDSISMLSLLEAINRKFGISVDDVRIASLRTYGDLLSLIDTVRQEQQEQKSADLG